MPRSYLNSMTLVVISIQNFIRYSSALYRETKIKKFWCYKIARIITEARPQVFFKTASGRISFFNNDCFEDTSVLIHSWIWIIYNDFVFRLLFIWKTKRKFYYGTNVKFYISTSSSSRTAIFYTTTRKYFIISHKKYCRTPS